MPHLKLGKHQYLSHNYLSWTVHLFCWLADFISLYASPMISQLQLKKKICFYQWIYENNLRQITHIKPRFHNSYGQPPSHVKEKQEKKTVLPITSQFLSFFHCMVIYFFVLRDSTVKTIYISFALLNTHINKSFIQFGHHTQSISICVFTISFSFQYAF